MSHRPAYVQEYIVSVLTQKPFGAATERLPADVREYLLSVLTALGQMNHITSKLECEHIKSKAHIVPHNGIMSMSVRTRQDLCDAGFALLKDYDGSNRSDVGTAGSTSVVATTTDGSGTEVSSTDRDAVSSAESDDTLPPL